jgi:prepilin-type N-terminal cleavage/methylation domain-containing protein
MTRRPGFTLIELLASVVVGSIVLLAAAAMLGSSGEGYERVGGGVATEREARALISQLASDLATARFHKDGPIESTGSAWPAARLGFFSLQPAEAQSRDGRIGDLCAVHYYIKDLEIGGKTVRCLMRGFRESADAFAALENDSISSLYQPDDRLDEPVAFNVAAFEARPMSRDAGGQWREWTRNDVKGPEAFDMKIVIVRRELAGRLRTTADWDGGNKQLGAYADAARNRYLETYGAMIRFGNHESF